MSGNFLSLLAVLVLISACDRKGGAPPPGGDSSAAPGSSGMLAAAPEPPQDQAVTTVDAGEPNTKFALVRGLCVQKSCAAEIRLLVNGQRLDAIPLEFAASDAKLTANFGTVSFATNQPLATYTGGEGEGTVTTAIQPIRLSPQRTGLLVQQAAGFEHVKRRRDLLIVENSRLKKVWSKQDGSGPVRSYADVVRRTPDADDLVLLEGITIAPAESDQVNATRLTWDEQGKSLQSTPVDAISAVVTGNFPNAELARARLADTCFANYWIVRADQVGGKTKSFVLALMTADSAAVTRNSRSDCSPQDVRRIARFRTTNESNR